jgi:hypothetical protein
MTAEPSLPVALVRASLPIVSVFGGLLYKLRVLVVLLCCAVLGYTVNADKCKAQVCPMTSCLLWVAAVAMIEHYSRDVALTILHLHVGS